MYLATSSSFPLIRLDLGLGTWVGRRRFLASLCRWPVVVCGCRWNRPPHRCRARLSAVNRNPDESRRQVSNSRARTLAQSRCTTASRTHQPHLVPHIQASSPQMREDRITNTSPNSYPKSMLVLLNRKCTLFSKPFHKSQLLEIHIAQSKKVPHGES